jgi:hypothetical protein
MKEYGVGTVTRNAAHRAVRLGGGDAYGRADEWRFRDPVTFDVDETPPPRIQSATVEVLESCDHAVFRDAVELYRATHPE